MAGNLHSYSQIIPYLSGYALEMLDKLGEMGIKDRDFAITIVEQFLTDEEMYVLPNDQDDE